MMRESFKRIFSENKNLMIYVSLILLFVTSIVIEFLTIPQSFKDVVGTLGGAGAVLSILVQLWRNQLSYEHTRDLLDKQQDFALGTASHMALIIYDKQVEFCDAYITNLHQCFEFLIMKGVSVGVLEHHNALRSIRLKYSAWLTDSIESQLVLLETALSKIGTGEKILENMPAGVVRTRLIDEVFNLFDSLVLNQARASQNTVTFLKIIDLIRNILGVTELTELREKVVRFAVKKIS